MELSEALQVLDVAPGAASSQVRAAYRRLLRAHHPDVAGPAGAPTTRRLIEAFETWRAHAALGVASAQASAWNGASDSGDDTPADARADWGADTRAAPTGSSPDDALVLFIDGDTMRLPFPAAEAFALLLRSAYGVGDVTYIDRESELLEALLRDEDGTIVSLVISLQGRSHGTDAFFTLEPLEAGRAHTLDVAVVVERFAELISGSP